MGSAPLTVVIPTYNNRFLVELCLRSMRCATSLPFKVIVKDNGSTDGTIEYLEASELVDLVIKSTDNDYDNVEYRTYDAIIREHVQTPYFLVCHSDMVFLQPDWIAEILNAAGTDETQILGGKLFPANFSGGWIVGRWVSPWYAWGRTNSFRKYDLTWQRKFPEWCATHLNEIRRYFDEELLAQNPTARLFWEHGGYLIFLVDRHRLKIVDFASPKVFHLGDMTGSLVKEANYPNAPDVPQRAKRAAAIRLFIRHTLEAEHLTNDDDFLRNCRSVVSFAEGNDLSVLRKFRA